MSSVLAVFQVDEDMTFPAAAVTLTTPVGAEVQDDVWTVTNFGDDLIVCSASKNAVNAGDIFYIAPADIEGDGVMDAVVDEDTNAVQARAIVVTPERFLVALGSPTPGVEDSADGNRTVRWADKESLTVWAATTDQGAYTEAGYMKLEGAGAIIAGRSGRGETLIWTETDLWTMRYIGGTLVYSFARAGDACGAISPHSMVVVDGKAIWMSKRGFHIYDGFVRTLPCEVNDYLFGDPGATGAVDVVNEAHRVFADIRAQFSEIWWYYIDTADTRRYVIYNYVENTWSVGQLDRSAGVDAGIPRYPIAVDSAGVVYWMESDAGEGAPGAWAESGPIELDEGDRVMCVRQIIPDGKTGPTDVEMTLYASFFPTGSEATFGPYSLANPTSVRLTGRQVRVKVETADETNWRFGAPRLEVVPAGLR